MVSTVSRDLFRELAGFQSRSGCALSMYLDLDPSVTPTIPDVDAKFRARLAEAEKLGESLSASRDCRLALRADIERIRAWRADGFDRDGAHGFALFVSGADDLFVALPLAGRVADAVQVGDELNLVPLVDQFNDDGALVAVVSRERGQVFRLSGGRLEEVVDETEDTPGSHDQGGWSQARYRRHIEHLIQQHLKHVGGAIDRQLRRPGGLQIVVVIPEEMRNAFAAELSTEARDAVIGWVSAEAHAGPAELLRAVRPVLDEADARRHEAVLERYEEALGRGERATRGWQATLEAAADTRVDVLLLGDGANSVVWQCPVDRRAYVEDGTCPVDGAALVERPDGADVAVHLALAEGGTVMRFGAGRVPDGIGALLRF
jgi:peptide chain release factor subunit 1